MLNKLEALYLNILRVVIIVLATVLLVVATIGAVVAGPMLLSSFGGGDADAARLVQKDSLNDYLNRHSGEGQVSQGQDQAELEDRMRGADRRFREAAVHIAGYVKAKTGMAPPEAGVIDYIQTMADSLPESLQDRYADSILALSKDLTKAPVSAAPVDVDSLIDWHFNQFRQAAETAIQQDAMRAAEDQARRQTAVLAATAAAGFFMMFLLLVFVFVLVKIERNLRRLPVLVEQKTSPQP